MVWSKEKKAAYVYDSVIKEVKGVIRYYGDASYKLELIEDDKK